MLDLSGTWRFHQGSPIFKIQHDVEDVNKISFQRIDGDRQSFFGHGIIDGDSVLISWRSTMRFGHGSDESREVDFDLITGHPIEIHWKGEMSVWQTVTN